MNDVIQRMRQNLTGIHVQNAEYRKEMNEVINFYEFYDGKPDNFKDLTPDMAYGQLWAVKANDYTPTREIRNHTKKLLDKQSRFMLGVPPTITMKPLDKAQTDTAEQKRMAIDSILDKGNFWSLTQKAFLDCTIGKRVLLCLVADPNTQEFQFKYFKMPEFTYTVDTQDYTKLTSVVICYQDERTVGKPSQDERWHKWTYEMRGPSCWYVYEIVDGHGNQAFQEVLNVDENGNELGGEPVIMPLRQELNTRFAEIPCKVITNGGLTGDIQGTSDVKDLIDLANSYNRTISDYRDAIKFKMFEQPVFIDADSDSLQNIKIAPNAIIDLKTDPSIGDGTGSTRMAQATTLSSQFNFAPAVDGYLDRLKKDMYELMDQPLPEQLSDVPSAKALKFLFFDLMARCEQKWREWDSAIKWLVGIMEQACTLGNFYPDLQVKSCMSTLTNINIEHNYPIPEDLEAKKDIAIKEVQANVLSHKTYIRKYGDVEDEDGEWEEIMEELDELNSSSNSGFMDTVDDELGGPVEGPTQVAGEGTEEDEEDNIKKPTGSKKPIKKPEPNKGGKPDVTK